MEHYEGGTAFPASGLRRGEAGYRSGIVRSNGNKALMKRNKGRCLSVGSTLVSVCGTGRCFQVGVGFSVGGGGQSGQVDTFLCL